MRTRGFNAAVRRALPSDRRAASGNRAESGIHSLLIACSVFSPLPSSRSDPQLSPNEKWIAYTVGPIAVDKGVPSSGLAAPRILHDLERRQPAPRVEPHTSLAAISGVKLTLPVW